MCEQSEKYFGDLNYSLANEDNQVELDIVNTYKPSQILAVAGSGCRALILCTSSPRQLSIIDLSHEQINLNRLKVEAIKAMSLKEYKEFLGVEVSTSQEIYNKTSQFIKTSSLSQQAKDKFLELRDKAPLIYAGKWEKTFIAFSKVARLVMGRKHLAKMCSFDNIKDQNEFYDQSFKKFRFSLVLRLLGNATLFNSLLYKGGFVQKNVEETHFEYYSKSFENLFRKTLLKENFFVQLCFFGKIIHEQAQTLEFRDHHFAQMKTWFLENSDSVYFLENSIYGLKSDKKYDFVSYSNVPSYFSGEMEKVFLNDISRNLSDKGIVVCRYYLKVPKVDDSLFDDISHEFIDVISKEKVGVYKIKVYRKK